MASKEAKVEVEFLGKAAEKLEKLSKETGLDTATLVSGAVSAYSSLTELASADGTVTIEGPDGKRYVIKIEVKHKK